MGVCKIDTVIKISFRDFLNFLKNKKKKKKMKMFFSKCAKFVWTPFFFISKSFGYFYQRKVIHNISAFVQNWQRYLFWPIVDLSQVWSSQATLEICVYSFIRFRYFWLKKNPSLFYYSSCFNMLLRWERVNDGINSYVREIWYWA